MKTLKFWYFAFRLNILNLKMNIYYKLRKWKDKIYTSIAEDMKSLTEYIDKNL